MRGAVPMSQGLFIFVTYKMQLESKLCPRGCDNCDGGFCQCQADIPPVDKVKCEEEADAAFVDCLTECDEGDMECHKLCSRLNADLKAECPCAVRCPHGCPCEGYHGCPLSTTTTASPSTTTASVDDKSKTSVLILSTFKNVSAPLLTDIASGEWVYPSGRGQFHFQLESKTEVFQSCSLIFAGRTVATFTVAVTRKPNCQWSMDAH